MLHLYHLPSARRVAMSKKKQDQCSAVWRVGSLLLGGRRRAGCPCLLLVLAPCFASAGLARATTYDYPPLVYKAQDKIPSADDKFFTDAEDTTHYWGAKNHRLVMSFVPLPRGYMGSRFKLRALISSGFKVRQVKLELPRTESSYWPSDTDIEGTGPLSRRRRLAGRVEQPLDIVRDSDQSDSAASFRESSNPRRARHEPLTHPLWSAFPLELSTPPKVVRHPTGTHRVKHPAHPPLHPHPERRLGACEPLPPNTENVVRQIFQKHGVSADGILEVKRAKSRLKTAKPFSEALTAAATEDTDIFDQELQLPPELLPPFSPDCPPDTACGLDYCALFICEGHRKQRSKHIRKRLTVALGARFPSGTLKDVKNLLWIPPKEVQLVVYVDVPPSPTSMQEDW
ncbi:hypothetical protein BESB_018580 [Besnoitia besnoiti]|uniref:Uncharacterized protein n=1 Tax=Besnoitia besnoiti TaxID=94643 RepID=A0A2A9MAY4_BESBE|nr:hypothetical protein BESB_018580 [Besnoitia besnoiti]PFH32540.1 hypothetical protein BESB_018580 [Besnoitia besnoiti]